VFENRVLRIISGPKRDEVTAGWRKLHNEEFHNLHFSPSIIRVIKSMRMTWAGDLARMRDKTNAYSLLVGKPEESQKMKSSFYVSKSTATPSHPIWCSIRICSGPYVILVIGTE
jgi:hypothetical protein